MFPFVIHVRLAGDLIFEVKSHQSDKTYHIRVGLRGRWSRVRKLLAQVDRVSARSVCSAVAGSHMRHCVSDEMNAVNVDTDTLRSYAYL
jgi:hypothetical protein